MISVQGLPELLSKLEPSKYGPDVRRFWDATTTAGERAGAAAAPKRSGSLAGSFSHDVESATLPSWGQVRVGAPYARPVLAGTRPHMPPVQAIAAMTGSMDKAWAVAMSIARRGTTARPFLGRVYRSMEGAARSGVLTLARAIESRFGR